MNIARLTGRLAPGIFFVCAITGLLASCSPKPPASRSDRLKWNLATLTNSYGSAGHANPKWDENAQEALKDFARTKTAPEDETLALSDLIAGAAENAVTAGCDDPMVRYLYVRYSPNIQAKPLGDRQELYRAAASNLQNSAYAPLQKFYANTEAAELLFVNRDKNRWPLVVQLRHAAIDNLNAAYQDQTLPEADAYQAAQALFEMLANNEGELTNAYSTLAATLANPGINPAVGALVKAQFYQQYAWIGRGHATANNVTDEQWQMFRERLAEAEKGLDEAWSRDPDDAQIPTLMISIALGQQKSRAEMEKWFDRAMKLDPNNYPACKAKLHYLLPQWYGSREDMVAFGRQCVATTNWGGDVPLTLVDAHSEFAHTLSGDEQKQYWALPDVWPDIKAGYERFAQTEPDATKFRYPYAWYAAHCDQWEDFKEQIQFIRQNDGHVDENYFGGAEEFQKLMDAANPGGAEAGQTNSPAK